MHEGAIGQSGELVDRRLWREQEEEWKKVTGVTSDERVKCEMDQGKIREDEERA